MLLIVSIHKDEVKNVQGSMFKQMHAVELADCRRPTDFCVLPFVPHHSHGQVLACHG